MELSGGLSAGGGWSIDRDDWLDQTDSDDSDGSTTTTTSDDGGSSSSSSYDSNEVSAILDSNPDVTVSDLQIDPETGEVTGIEGYSDDGFGGTTDTSGGSTSDGTADRYGTDPYDGNVPSGYVGAVDSGAEEQLQSDQVNDLEDELDGNLDRQTVDVTVNEDGSTSLSGESDTGDTATVTTDTQPFADNASGGSGISMRQILLGFAAAGAVYVGVSYGG
ncbi:hypothetical protein [Halostella sp. PRR32]|uniref:hypothetical protein n=1 Tax=Halostella sp. PRR32 TaxID=3098147 RepID=UPI002B1D0832|nr:hypothetical protein [Halostella sp. PRR32]